MKRSSTYPRTRHAPSSFFTSYNDIFVFPTLHERLKGGGERNGTTTCLGRELFAEERFECLAVLGKLLDPLVELVKGHLVLEEGPAEFGLVVDVGDLVDGLDGWNE